MASEKFLHQTAPDFALRSFSGQNLRLSEYRSAVVIVNFWAEWCGSCQEQLAVMDDLVAEFGAMGLEVLSINIDKDDAKARRAVSKMELKYLVLSDDEKRVSRLYELGRTPALLLVDVHGVVRHIHEGYESGDDQVYRSELTALLSEKMF